MAVGMKLRKHTVLLSVIILALLGGLSYLNYRFKLYAVNGVKEESTEEASFSLITFNIASTQQQDFTTDFQAKLLKLIKEENPDIVCFQELSFENLDKIRHQLDSIYGPCFIREGVDQSWRLRFYSHFPLRNFRKYHCEGEIDTVGLTEKEIEDVRLSQRQMGIMSAELEVGQNHWITLYSGHLRSSAYSTARRSMEKDASWFDGISLYKRNYDVGKLIRDYEAENTRRYIDDAHTDSSTGSGIEMPVIVAGDLNDWCGSDCLNTLMGDDLKDAWWEGGNGFGWTYFGWHLRLRLDHILYSDELELVDVKVIDSDLSDHKPLMARFRFK